MKALKHLRKLFMLVIMQMVQVYIEGWELMMLPPKAPTRGQAFMFALEIWFASWCFSLAFHPL
jgi:hypothetical protein